MSKNTPIKNWAAASAKSFQSCPTLCDPIDGSPLGSSVPGIFQARVLECVAIAFSSKKATATQTLSQPTRFLTISKHLKSLFLAYQEASEQLLCRLVAPYA